MQACHLPEFAQINKYPDRAYAIQKLNFTSAWKNLLRYEIIKKS